MGGKCPQKWTYPWDNGGRASTAGDVPTQGVLAKTVSFLPWAKLQADV